MKEMSLEEHLTELRKTLVRVLFIVAGSFIAAYLLGDHISEYLLRPLRSALADHPEGGKIIYLGILDKVLSQFQVAFWSSLLLSAPLWFREVWLFIRPGLLEHEVKVVRPFIMVGFVLFVLGVLFGYYVVFPITFDTLLGFGVSGVEAALGLKEYLILCSKVLVFLGVIFQLPNVLLILGFMGLVTKYSLRKIRRYIYVGLMVFSAMLTPPDILTMLGLWLPMVVLFELGLLAVAAIVHPYLEKQYAD